MTLFTVLAVTTNTFTSFSMKELTEIDPDVEYRMYAVYPIIAIISTMFHSIFNDVNEVFRNTHLTQNIINCANALITVLIEHLFGMDAAFGAVVAISSGFFINDIVVNWNMSRNDKKNPLFNPFIYHHMITIYALFIAYNGVHRELILTVYHYMELSNILMYVTSICETLLPEYTNLIMLLYHHQLLVFIPIRVFWYPYYLLIENYDEFFSMGAVYNLLALAIYMLGLIWSRELYRRCSRDMMQRSINVV